MDRRGFSREQRSLADELLAKRSVGAVLATVASRHCQLNGVNVITALHHAARCSHGLEHLDPMDFDLLLEKAKAEISLSDIDPRGIANTAWALAVLSFYDVTLFDAIA